jgi:hypothetical protein
MQSQKLVSFFRFFPNLFKIANLRIYFIKGKVYCLKFYGLQLKIVRIFGPSFFGRDHFCKRGHPRNRLVRPLSQKRSGYPRYFGSQLLSLTREQGFVIVD